MLRFTSPFGELHLERYPQDDGGRLRAYDGADRYLLEEFAHVRAERQLEPHSRVVVGGDQHGALSTALAGVSEVESYVDSFLALRAIERNLAANDRRARTACELPAPGDDVQAVIVRIPKSLALLAAQLHALSGQLAPGTPVIAGAMTKHLSRTANEIFSQYIGDVTASLGRHKARLLTAIFDPQRRAEAPRPTAYDIPGTPIALTNLPGTYAAQNVDLGTRVLLEHLPPNLGEATVADVGCGNGILAIASAAGNPSARYTLIDESAQAIASAKLNWRAAFGDRQVRFALGDGLSDEPQSQYDVVLCNPPFHHGFAVDAQFAQRLLAQAHSALRSGGQLFVVGNRHLDYGQFLRRQYRQVDQLAATAKFTVLRARK